MISLEAISIPPSFFGGLSQQNAPEQPKVRCILSSGPLAESDHLNVLLNGTPIPGGKEHDQWVCAWQLFKGTDEIRVIFVHGEIESQSWRGCWDERDAILHAGTLPIQIRFNGKLQPMTAGTTHLVALSPTTDPLSTNGHCSVPVPIALDEYSQSEKEQDGPSDTVVQPELPGTQDHSREFSETLEQTETNELKDAETSSRAEEQSRALAASEQHLVSYSLTHAATAEQILQTLKALLEQMPANTMMIDLRKQDRTPRKKMGSQNHSLKDVLRAVFGAKYWDRGWAINTEVQAVPTQQGSSRGEVVITNPEYVEGLGMLIEAYREGYSLLLIDQWSRYEQSTLSAVIQVLRHHFPTLSIREASPRE